jgi:hypothetical protein
MPTPELLDQGQSWRPDPGSMWKQELYTCSSAVKASVREVTLSTNGSTALEALQVIDIKEKNYNSTARPIWAIETVNSSQYDIWDVNKFWGLVDESHATDPDVEIHHADSIYLPSAMREKALTEMYDSFAAGLAFTAAWFSVYNYAATNTETDTNHIPKYVCWLILM